MLFSLLTINSRGHSRTETGARNAHFGRVMFLETIVRRIKSITGTDLGESNLTLRCITVSESGSVSGTVSFLQTNFHRANLPHYSSGFSLVLKSTPFVCTFSLYKSSSDWNSMHNCPFIFFILPFGGVLKDPPSLMFSV